MLPAFQKFMDDVERAYPHSFAEGDFDYLADMLTGLSNETTACGIRVSDMAVQLLRSPDIIEKMYLMGKLSHDLKFLGPEKICTRLNNHRIDLH